MGNLEALGDLLGPTLTAEARRRLRLDRSQSRVVELVRRHGRKVRCEECGTDAQVKTSGNRRLRELGCAECGGRLRPRSWYAAGNTAGA